MKEHPDIADFVRHRSPVLLRYAILLVGDRAAAEDLLQDALVRLYEAWGRVDNPDAYVRRSMYTLSVSRWRKILRREHVTDRVPERAATPPADVGEREEVLAALATLPMRARACVVLHYYEDRPAAEIAEILDISPGAVRTTLTRARQSLRLALTPAEVTA